VRVISDQAFDFESPDALAFDGSNIWVANERGASVTEISAADGTLVRNITRGGLDDPDSFAFDGTHIWVGSDSSSDLTEINASDGSIARAFSISCAKALAFDGTHLWLACGRPTEVDPGDGSVVGPQGDSAELGFFNVAGIAVADGHLWVTNSVRENDDFPLASLAELPLG
jgi:DNA-binding beta-propeller fold protein YncE